MNPQANAIKRRSKDFSVEAALTLKEFESILVQHFISYNRTVMKSYKLTLDQIRDRIVPSPINIYRHGLRSRSGLLRRYTEDDMRLKLLPSKTASITENGLSVNGMSYRPEKGVDRTSWFVHGRKKTTHITVSYDPTRTDSIMVHDSTEARGYFVANLNRESEKFRGMSLLEAQDIMSIESELLSSHDYSRAQNRALANEHTDSTAKKAKSLTAQAAKGRSKTSRRQDTKVAREVERNMERDQSATRSTSGEKYAPATPSDYAGSNVHPLRAPAAAKQNRAAALAKSARAGIFNGSMPL